MIQRLNVLCTLVWRWNEMHAIIYFQATLKRTLFRAPKRTEYNLYFYISLHSSFRKSIKTEWCCCQSYRYNISCTCTVHTWNRQTRRDQHDRIIGCAAAAATKPNNEWLCVCIRNFHHHGIIVQTEKKVL